MNIHKYLLPASLAAMVHVALFWFLPEGTRPDGTILIEMPVLPPILKSPDDEVTPPEEKEETTRPVTKMSGGPSRSEIPDPATPPKPGDITIPVPDMPINPWKDPKKILPDTGPGGPGEIGPGDWTGKTIVDAGALDSAPRAKVQLPPDYPYAMKQSGTGGSVLVEFDVNAAGRVVRAEAVRYSGRDFVEPAVRAVRKWQFEPGRRHGQAVPFRMTVPIEFGVENN
jgi:protein TonB